MPDELRRSAEALEAPDCPNCRIPMKWYRSIRASQTPLVIDHFFICDDCHRLVGHRDEPSVPASVPPTKLSLPIEYRPAA
jgi:hypothetical protein